MKTLRLLCNVAALFILGMALVVSQPGSGQAATAHGHCAHTDYETNCIRVGTHDCGTIPCFFANNCHYEECVH